jgi:hypothetical protein
MGVIGGEAWNLTTRRASVSRLIRAVVPRSAGTTASPIISGRTRFSPCAATVRAWQQTIARAITAVSITVNTQIICFAPIVVVGFVIVVMRYQCGVSHCSLLASKPQCIPVSNIAARASRKFMFAFVQSVKILIACRCNSSDIPGGTVILLMLRGSSLYAGGKPWCRTRMGSCVVFTLTTNHCKVRCDQKA